MGYRVAKFGGSSLATAKQFEKVANIVRQDARRKYVVPSAPGKAFDSDIKVTDLFYQYYEQAQDAQGGQTLEKIRRRFVDIAEELGLKVDMDAEIGRIEEDIRKGASRDYAASRGEYLSGKLLADYLGFEFFDPKEGIFFQEDGTLDEEKTQTVLSAYLKAHPNTVIPGFYGSMPNGEIKTFSRGGSDITGAIVARAIGAEVYENWTDVSGILMTDPRIVQDPRPIKLISYSELRELSYMGATVLHEESIFPVKREGIPINVRNTNCPEDDGTMIVDTVLDEAVPDIVTGIAGRKGFTIIHLEKGRMNSELGFGRRVLQAFEEEGISFEHLPSGIDTLSVVVEDVQLEGKLERVLEKLAAAVQPDMIDVHENLALIATVGHGMIRHVGICARLFSALGAAGVNVRLIDQGSSELNIIVGVESDDFEAAVRAIYAEFTRS